jgi:proteasome accessory factor B
MLNLLFVLLNAPVPITRAQITDRVPGYGGSDDALEKMFERDKATLRELGIPLETQPIDLFHDDVVGYRIDRSQWLMPEISLTAQERTYLSLAASAWETAQLRTAAQQAVRRIDAQEFDDVANIPISLAKGRRHIAEILGAITNDKTLVFEYVGQSDDKPTKRTVDPWRALLHSGHWYLVGFDQDRGEVRTFRTDRIVGDVVETSHQRVEHPPDDFSISELVAEWESLDSGSKEAQLLIRPGKGASLRLLASAVEYGEEWDRLAIPYFHDSQLVGLIASSCHVTRVIEPASLHASVSRIVLTTLSVHNNGK